MYGDRIQGETLRERMEALAELFGAEVDGGGGFELRDAQHHAGSLGGAQFCLREARIRKDLFAWTFRPAAHVPCGGGARQPFHTILPYNPNRSSAADIIWKS